MNEDAEFKDCTFDIEIDYDKNRPESKEKKSVFSIHKKRPRLHSEIMADFNEIMTNLYEEM